MNINPPRASFLVVQDALPHVYEISFYDRDRRTIALVKAVRRPFILFICMILCWASVPSHAAEIACAGFRGRCYLGLLSGQISKGDYDKIVTFLRANYSSLATLALVSPGGDVDEALKIGRLFRKYLLSTEAPWQLEDGTWGLPLTDTPPQCRGSDCACASACALIWFGGVDRTGTVGLHRPRINDPMFRGLSPAEASTVYRQALEKIATYLDEMEAPRPIIELMITTGSDDIRWVDFIDDGLDRPPSMAEWEDASCGPGNNNRGLETTQEQHDAVLKKELCKGLLFDDRRGRLAPP